MAQVNFRIDAEQKEDWKDWLDDSKEYSTLTDLIRSSVEAEINRDNIPQGSPAISEDIQRLRSDMKRIQRDVRWIRETLQDESDISDTAQELLQELEVLPSLDGSKAHDEPVPREVHAAYQVVNPEGPEDDYHPQTKSALCERVGIREDTFDEAIEHPTIISSQSSKLTSTARRTISRRNNHARKLPESPPGIFRLGHDQ